LHRIQTRQVVQRPSRFKTSLTRARKIRGAIGSSRAMANLGTLAEDPVHRFGIRRVRTPFLSPENVAVQSPLLGVRGHRLARESRLHRRRSQDLSRIPRTSGSSETVVAMDRAPQGRVLARRFESLRRSGLDPGSLAARGSACELRGLAPELDRPRHSGGRILQLVVPPSSPLRVVVTAQAEKIHP
jgi:hypothetical protein